jgi:hypothetical protein
MPNNRGPFLRAVGGISLVLGLSGCHSSNRTALEVLRSTPKKYEMTITVPFSCGSLKVGQFAQEWVVVNGGIKPYVVSWYFDGKTAKDAEERVTPVTNGQYQPVIGGLKYTVGFTPSATSETVSFRATDSRGDDIETSLIGPKGPCHVAPSGSPT